MPDQFGEWGPTLFHLTRPPGERGARESLGSTGTEETGIQRLCPRSTGRLLNRKGFLAVLEAGKCKLKAPAEWVSSEGLVPGSSFSLCPQSRSFYKGPNPIQEGLTSQIHHLQMPPHLRGKVSTYEFWGDMNLSHLKL